METCVRGAHYDEALELLQYVTKLQRRFSHISVVKKVSEMVQNCQIEMVNQLTSQLHQQISLPFCLKIVAYLRRLNVYSEAELRIAFLTARDAWFQSQLHSVPKEDAYQYVMKIMECSRTHLFDIVTQYRAVFSDDDPVSMSLPAFRDELINEASIFQGWLLSKIDQFLTILEESLQSGVLTTRLDSVLAQTMYFGLSMGRVGADFRSLAVPLFENAVVNELQLKLAIAVDKIKSAAHDDTLLKSPRLMSSYLKTNAETDELHPPVSVVEYPPLAHYLNMVLSAFNNLRVCLPITIASRVANSLESSLNQIGDILIQYSCEKQLSDDNKERVLKFANELVNVLLPYLNRCLDHMFPWTLLAQHLGFSVIGDENFDIVKIKPERLCDALAPYLPSKPNKDIVVVQPQKQTVLSSNYVANDPNSNEVLLEQQFSRSVQNRLGQRASFTIGSEDDIDDSVNL